jgi:hypothetical protein
MPGDPAFPRFPESSELSVDGIEAGTEISHDDNLQVFEPVELPGTEVWNTTFFRERLDLADVAFNLGNAVAAL